MSIRLKPQGWRKDATVVQKTSVPTSRITPGMKLAEPITNASGVTLMPAGIRLTPMFIARLQKLNIESVQVLVEQGEDTRVMPPPPEQAAAPRRAAGQKTVKPATGEYTLTAEQETFARAVATEISRIFVSVRENPLMMQLRAVAIKRLIMHGPEGMINILRRPQVQPPREKV